ncbi:MAG: glycosyltransferase [Anaerolineales bacterium]|nr:glycosyltransferase [Anaerolineales bacterium]
MKRLSALILCAVDPNINPRPNRMIRWLIEDFDVTVVGWTETSIKEAKSIALLPLGTIKPGVTALERTGNLMRRLLRGFVYLYRLAAGRYEDIVWSQLGQALKLREQLKVQNFDLIVSHDCVMLPLAFSARGNRTKIIFDAREYYPKNYDDQLRWRLLTKPVNQYLCDTYLQKCDLVLTVSPGLAREYAEEYGVSPEVVLSLPIYRELEPSPVDDDSVRIVYHGLAGESRKTEVMIEMMDFVEERFQLDLMLMPTDDSYYRRIISMVESRKNVKIIPPVSMSEIPSFINQYDIGLFLCPPANFNLEFALPNKLFEFIQGRLAVAIGPNKEMKKVVERYQCGVVAPDFDPRSLAQALNALTPEAIMQYKRKSHLAAAELSAETSRKQVRELFRSLLEGMSK